MTNVENLDLHRNRLSGELVHDVVEAIQALGGAAHRNMIADLLIERRLPHWDSQTRKAATADLAAQIDRVLTANETGPAAIFERPFGPGSQRWALKPQAPATSLFAEDGGR